MGEAQAVSTAKLGATEQLPREQFWNLPNTITVFRMAVVPVLMLLPFADGEYGSDVLAWFYIVAATSDIVDGWLARRGQQVGGAWASRLPQSMCVTPSELVKLATSNMKRT